MNPHTKTIAELVPKKTFHARYFTNKIDIANAMTEWNIYAYVYQFRVNDEVLKIGFSCSEELAGERVYRQMGNIPVYTDGEVSYPLCGNSGSEMRESCKIFEHRYNTLIDINDVHVDIWDIMPVYDPRLGTVMHQGEYYENQLIAQHLEKNHVMPPGNKILQQRSLVDGEKFSSLFKGNVDTPPPLINKSNKQSKPSNYHLLFTPRLTS